MAVAGSTVVHLSKPVRIGVMPVRKLRFAAPSLELLEGIERIRTSCDERGEPPIVAMAAMLAYVTGKPRRLIEALTPDDFSAAVDGLGAIYDNVTQRFGGQP